MIKLIAASLNRINASARNGWPGLHLDFPRKNCADGAGEVIALGEGTNRIGLANMSSSTQILVAGVARIACPVCITFTGNGIYWVRQSAELM